MLLKDFYTVLQSTGPNEEISSSGIISNRYQFHIELNPLNPVYEGHFSGNPVVPGVCQVQIISEVLSLIRNASIRLIYADNVKFLSLMVPDKNRFIEAEIQVRNLENGDISVNAILKDKETVFIKFKGVFRNEV